MQDKLKNAFCIWHTLWIAFDQLHKTATLNRLLTPFFFCHFSQNIDVLLQRVPRRISRQRKMWNQTGWIMLRFRARRLQQYNKRIRCWIWIRMHGIRTEWWTIAGKHPRIFFTDKIKSSGNQRKLSPNTKINFSQNFYRTNKYSKYAWFW